MDELLIEKTTNRLEHIPPLTLCFLPDCRYCYYHITSFPLLWFVMTIHFNETHADSLP